MGRMDTLESARLLVNAVDEVTEGRRGRLLTSEDLAKVLGVHQQTVRRWIWAGRIKPYLILPNGAARFRVDDLAHLFKEGKGEGHGQT